VSARIHGSNRGQRKGDLGVLRLRRRSSGLMNRTAASIPEKIFAEIADEAMCPICGAREADFRGLEPEVEIPED
jgi:hypothetical protein